MGGGKEEDKQALGKEVGIFPKGADKGIGRALLVAVPGWGTDAVAATEGTQGH